jgi:hypothetical protein
LPDVTEQQERVKNAIESAVKAAGCAEIVHRREWLGYLPFGAYHWIECAGHDVEDLPFDFASDDLATLEHTGFLEKTGEPPISKDALILGNDIEEYLDSEPVENIRKFREEIVAFVESDDYTTFARRTSD